MTRNRSRDREVHTIGEVAANCKTRYRRQRKWCRIPVYQYDRQNASPSRLRFYQYQYWYFISWLVWFDRYDCEPVFSVSEDLCTVINFWRGLHRCRCLVSFSLVLVDAMGSLCFRYPKRNWLWPFTEIIISLSMSTTRGVPGSLRDIELQRIWWRSKARWFLEFFLIGANDAIESANWVKTSRSLSSARYTVAYVHELFRSTKFNRIIKIWHCAVPYTSSRLDMLRSLDADKIVLRDVLGINSRNVRPWQLYKAGQRIEDQECLQLRDGLVIVHRGTIDIDDNEGVASPVHESTSDHCLHLTEYLLAMNKV